MSSCSLNRDGAGVSSSKIESSGTASEQSSETSSLKNEESKIENKIKPISEEDFTIYDMNGNKLFYLGKEFKEKKIKGYEYVGRRELRKMTREDIYFFDAYMFSNDNGEVYTFNYDGDNERSLQTIEVCSVHLRDKNIQSSRGIKLGDTQQDVLSKYGTPGYDDFDAIAYNWGEKNFQLSFHFDSDNKVSQIALFYFPEELQFVEFPDEFE